MLFKNIDTEFNPRTANPASVFYTVYLTMTLDLHVSGRHIPRQWGLASKRLDKTHILKLADEFTITSHPCHSFLSTFVSTSTTPAVTQQLHLEARQTHTRYGCSTVWAVP